MARRRSFLDRLTSFFGMSTGVVGILATLALIFDMFAFWWYTDQFFGATGPSDLMSNIVSGGFLTIVLFNILAIIWVILDGYYFQKYTAFDFTLIMFGVACIILTYGEKSVIEEIGRENSLGLKTTGEWVILYILLFIQMIYNVLILLRRFAAHLIGYGDDR